MAEAIYCHKSVDWLSQAGVIWEGSALILMSLLLPGLGYCRNVILVVMLQARGAMDKVS